MRRKGDDWEEKMGRKRRGKKNRRSEEYSIRYNI